MIFGDLNTFKTRKYGWGDYVWRCTELGFGDTWAVTSYLLRISQEINKPVKVFSHNKRFVLTVRDVKKHLNTYGDIEFVHTVPTAKMSYCEPYKAKFLPTKKLWNCSTNIVAYQFDGRHLAKVKNINYNYVLRVLKSKGYVPINLGGYKPLDFIIDILSKCKFFLGSPSGMSVVSMSVGNPAYVIGGGLSDKYLSFMSKCQYQNGVTVFKFTKSFLQSVVL